MKTGSFWVDTEDRPEGLTTRLPDKTEILVVGAGLTGMSAALRLSTAEHEVVVIDRGKIGSGASSRAVGVVSPEVKGGVDTVYAAYGPRIGHGLWASAVQGVGLLRDLASRPGVSAVLSDGGHSQVGKGGRQLRRFDRDVAWYQSKFPTELRVIDAREIKEFVGGDAFNVAIHEPNALSVHPARLAFGLARETKREGTSIVEDCALVHMTATPGGFSVETSQGTIEAKQVVLATNGLGVADTSPELARLIYSEGYHVVATEPLDQELVETVLPARTPVRTATRKPLSVAATSDYRLVVGSPLNLQTDLSATTIASSVLAEVTTFWPQLASVEATHSWSGTAGYSFDGLPHIGTIGGIWYAAGYSGLGLALACQAGFELAGMLMGDNPSVFSELEHNGRVYHSGGSPWFLPVKNQIYQLLDKLGV